jgi:hypothetical protein
LSTHMPASVQLGDEFPLHRPPATPYEPDVAHARQQAEAATTTALLAAAKYLT